MRGDERLVAGMNALRRSVREQLVDGGYHAPCVSRHRRARLRQRRERARDAARCRPVADPARRGEAPVR